MHIQLTPQWTLLFRLLVTGLLIMVSSLCRAEEQVGEPAVQPSDPREVFRQSGINSFDKGALSNIVMRGYQRENLMIIHPC